MSDREGTRLEFDLNTEEYNYWQMDNSDTEQENQSIQQSGGPSHEQKEDYIVDDIDVGEVMNMTFESEEHAYEFYNLYGKISGFSIRKADVTKKDDGTAKYRKFVCSREGKRHKKWESHVNRIRQPKPQTRVLCPALLRIKYESNLNKYVVTDFVKEHNHKMAAKSSIKYLRSHRKFTEADYAQASALRTSGVKISQIMKFFAMQCGGYGNIGFVLKDLYNHIELEERKEIDDGDAEGAIAYFTGRKAADPMFYFEYEADIEGRLKNILWMDSISVMDYKAFGDVLVFDSTYNTNDYHKPLVVLAGVNNHFGTIVYGSALVSEESTETYEWILSTLVKANGGKKPVSVVTDGDKSMRRAIENVLPDARHRLCTFHLKRNAETGTNKCERFTSMFGKFMKKAIPVEEFEEEWNAVVTSCGLDRNAWVKKIYEKRLLWAETLLRGCFFAGMRSTQRCEQMNAFLKRYIKPNMRMYQFVKVHALALDFLREKEAKARHETEDTFLMLSTELHALEQHAAETYTRNIFINVRKHLGRQGLYDCFKREQTRGGCLYYLGKYRDSRTWVVELDRGSQGLRCSCKKFEWKGLPCAHMFRVMVMENLQKIPSTCIMKRWTMNAKEDTDFMGSLGAEGVYDEMQQAARYGTLMTDCKGMCFYASHMGDGYEAVKAVIHKETKKWKEAFLQRGIGLQKNDGPSQLPPRASRIGILDPVRTVAKGDHRNKDKNKHIKCGNCGRRDGHNKRTCQKMLGSNGSNEQNRIPTSSFSGFQDGNESLDRGEHIRRNIHGLWDETASNALGRSTIGGHAMQYRVGTSNLRESYYMQQVQLSQSPQIFNNPNAAYYYSTENNGIYQGHENDQNGSQQNSNAVSSWF